MSIRNELRRGVALRGRRVLLSLYLQVLFENKSPITPSQQIIDSHAQRHELHEKGIDETHGLSRLTRLSYEIKG